MQKFCSNFGNLQPYLHKKENPLENIAEYGSVSSLGTIKLIDFKKALEAMEDNKTDNNSNPEEVQFSLIYLTELEQQATSAKRGELDKWKHQNVYVQEEDIGH